MVANSGQEAVNNGDRIHTYSPGYCQQFVRGPCWEVGSLYGSAIDAWNGAHEKHPGDRNPPTGAPCYYRGGQYGHAVIYQAHDSGRIRSTDCQTTGNVNDDALSWPERAWGYEYLGWTGDINGVDLPLGGGGGGGNGDDMPKYGHARHTGNVNLKPGDWYAITWTEVDTGECFNRGDAGVSLGGRDYTLTLTARVSDRDGAHVRTSLAERKDGDVVEESPPLVHVGADAVVDSRTGRVADGRVLRARIMCDKAAVLEQASLGVLYW